MAQVNLRETHVSGSQPKHKTPPGPYGYPVLGILPHMRRNSLRFLTEAVRRYGDVVLLRMGPKKVYLLSHPDHIAHVLQDNHRNYRKGELVERVKPFLGEGLATSDGELWRSQRHLTQPAFHRQQVARLAAVVTDATAEMLERWQNIVSPKEPLNILKEMMQLTGEIIVRAMFGSSIGPTVRALTDDFGVATEYILRRILALTDWGARVPTPRRRRFRLALQRLDKVVWSIIEERRRDTEDRADLLSMLLLARDAETGRQMTDRQLRDEVMTMFFAGHETTGLALTWTWYLLAEHLEAGEQLRWEVANVLGNRGPTFEDLPNLPYTRMVIQEAMRLYPPSWIISRAPLADDEIAGYRIPAGATVFLSQYVTHRHPQFWERPEEFDPERFSPRHTEGRPRYAYFPFSGGPRQCIGEQFAMMEAQLVVAKVAQRCTLALVPGQCVEMEPLLTLRPRGSLQMFVEEYRG